MIFKIQTIQNQIYVSANYHRWAVSNSKTTHTDDRVDELIVAQGQYQIGDILCGQSKMFFPIDVTIDIGESEKKWIHPCIRSSPLKLKRILGITELLEPKQKF